MKRTGNLIHKIYELDNLYLAYYKAKKGKESKKDIHVYSNNLHDNLLILQNELKTGNISIGNYHFFTIYDPKERQICAASFSERVLHHAIMNICHPVFEKLQIFDSYATRKHKGTYAALNRAKFFQSKYKWYVKIDIRKYFDSIDHNILFNKLQRKFKEPELLQLFKKIINSYEVLKGKGLPIGNLTSQYFANFYLSFADRYVQQELKISSYVRYMDDMVLWSNNKEKLLKAKNNMEQFLLNELSLNVKINILQKNSHGLVFLGYRIFKNYTRFSKRSKKRFINKAKQYQKQLVHGEYNQFDYQKHILPLIAYTKYAETYGIRKKIFY